MNKKVLFGVVWYVTSLVSVLHGSENIDEVVSRGIGYVSSDSIGILAPSYAKIIKASDFSTGPVVITEPGYYVLAGSVEFVPRCPYTVDPSGSSWKSAIIILADHVTLDLNRNALFQDISSYYVQDFKVIQLGGINPRTIESSVQWYTPSNVVIKNGTIGKATGFGIYGQNNSEITISDVSIQECSAAGVYLENVQHAYLKNITISGSTDAHAQGYGILLRDNSTTQPWWTSAGQGSSGPRAVTLENISINDVYTTADGYEVHQAAFYMRDLLNALNTSSLYTAQQKVGVHEDVYDAAQAVIDTIASLKSKIANFLDLVNSDNAKEVIDACLAVNTDLTGLASAYQAHSNASVNAAVNQAGQAYADLVTKVHDYTDVLLVVASDTIRDYVQGQLYSAGWNAYAIRVIKGEGIAFKNCRIMHTYVDSLVDASVYACGIACHGCKAVELQDCSVATSHVRLGYALGFLADGGCSGMAFTGCQATNITSTGGSYGFYLHTSKAQRFEQCKALACTGYLNATGFYNFLTAGNTFTACVSANHSCVSEQSSDASVVCGFSSQAGLCNKFLDCQAYNLIADSAYLHSSYAATTKAIGFELAYDASHPLVASLYDRGSIVERCMVENNDGCGGSAIGIYLNGAVGSRIMHNTVAFQMSRRRTDIDPDVFVSLGNGYGIYDTASDTSALMVKNMAYANQTLNYKVLFSLPNEKLPVAQSSYGDMTGVYMANEWDNISLNPNPGAYGCVDACAVVPEYTGED